MEENTKSFKDPAYGYIEIPSDLVRDVIDTEAFQRLRRIVQTSYEPLYPSATHNRFIHSLGVYHLGDLVASVVEAKSFPALKSMMGKFTKKYHRYLEIFRLACLLHDVGHAPFSHTGEEFYITREEKGNATRLHWRIANLCGDKSFPEEMKKREKSAAPHELMSIVIALTTFGKLFRSADEKTFFARAIAGYPYAKKAKTKDHVDSSFLNCLISLLNSSIVDVDRLDYLIRDAIATGFKTVTIDYQRLLGGVRIRRLKDKCEVVFTKRSISVLENVVFAHDAERKWVQNHPAIAYEMKMLKEAFSSVNARFASELPGKTIFCENALTGKGIVPTKCHKSMKVKYLCDDDIVFLMKNLEDTASHSFFSRKDRYSPLWKSEAEFCALFHKDVWKDNLPRLKRLFESFAGFLKRLDISEINASASQKLRKELVKARKVVRQITQDSLESFDKVVIVGQRELFCGFLDVLRKFSKDQGCPFKFQILDAKMFKSGFETGNLADILIELGKEEYDIVKFGNITRVLGGRSDNSDLPKNIYYVFAKKICGNKVKLSHELVDAVRSFVCDNAEKIDKFFAVGNGDAGKWQIGCSSSHESQSLFHRGLY